MKRTYFTVALYAMLAIILAWSFASAIAAASEPGDLIHGGQRTNDATQIDPPALPDIGPADMSLRIYRLEKQSHELEQRIARLEASRQASQPCNCASGGQCTCGQGCQCGKPAQPVARAAVVDPVTGIAVDRPTAIMLSMPGCQPCVSWWGVDGQPSERTAAKAKGWAVEKTEKVAAASYPRYRIFDGVQWFDHVGFLKTDRLADLRRR